MASVATSVATCSQSALNLGVAKCIQEELHESHVVVALHDGRRGGVQVEDVVCVEIHGCLGFVSLGGFFFEDRTCIQTKAPYTAPTSVTCGSRRIASSAWFGAPAAFRPSANDSRSSASSTTPCHRKAS